MANLAKVFTQLSTKNALESDFSIEVEFDPATGEVDAILSVRAYNFRKETFTDLTNIFTEHFSDQLDQIVDSIDWLEVYANREILSLENS